MTDPKGKSCPICTSPMSDLSSQQIRQCTNGKCRWTQVWLLDDGQKPLMTSNRDTRR